MWTVHEIRAKLLRPFAAFGAWESGAFGTAHWGTPQSFYLTFFGLTGLGLAVLASYLMVKHLRTATIAAGPQVTPVQRAAQRDSPSVAHTQELGQHWVPPDLQIPERSVHLFVYPQIELADGTAEQIKHLQDFFEGSGYTARVLSTSLPVEGVMAFLCDLPGVRKSDTLCVEAVGADKRLHRLVENISRGIDGGLARRLRGWIFRGIYPTQTHFREIVVVTALGGDQEAELKRAGVIYDTLTAITKTSVVQVPVSFVFVDAQSIEYFPEFVSHLDLKERKQPFGITTHYDSDTNSDPGSGSAFMDLSTNLSALRIHLLEKANSEGKSEQERRAIFEFPRKWRKYVSPDLQEFVDRCFPLMPGDACRAVLRGIYMVGRATISTNLEHTTVYGRQEPRPRVVQRLETVFLTELFGRVLYEDKLKAFIPKKVRVKRLLLAGFGVMAVFTLALLILSAVSFSKNRALLMRAHSAIEANLRVPELPPTALQFARLDPLLDVVRELDNTKQTSNLPDMGLYMGDGVRKSIRGYYLGQLRAVLLDDVIRSLRTELGSLGTDAPRLSKDAAEKALILYQVMHAKCKPSASFVNDIARYWLAKSGSREDVLNASRRHFAYYAKELEVQEPYGLPWEKDLAESAERYVSASGSGEARYADIIATEGVASSEAIVYLKGMLANQSEQEELAANYGSVMKELPMIQRSFLAERISPIQARLMDLGGRSVGSACEIGLRTSTTNWNAKYAGDYMQHWKTILAGVHIRTFGGNPSVAVKRLAILTGNRSPLLAALLLVSKNTRSAAGQRPDRPPDDGFSNMLQTIFRPVHKIVPVDPKSNWIDDSNRAYINSLQDLRASVVRVVEAPNKEAADKAREGVLESAKAVGKVVDSVKLGFGNGTEGVDELVEALLREPIEETESSVRSPDVAGQVNKDVKAFCQSKDFAAVRAKYPFNRGDISAGTPKDQFEAFFRPEATADPKVGRGFFWRYFGEKKIANRVKRGEQMVWEKGPALEDLNFSNEFRSFLDRMASISDSLFMGSELGRKLTIEITSSSGLDAKNVRLGGQAGSGNSYLWPGPDPNAGFSVQTNSADLIYTSVWGIFRMIDAAEPKEASTVRLTKVSGQGRAAESLLKLGGQPAWVEVKLPDFPGGIRGALFDIKCPDGPVVVK